MWLHVLNQKEKQVLWWHEKPTSDCWWQLQPPHPQNSDLLQTKRHRRSCQSNDYDESMMRHTTADAADNVETVPAVPLPSSLNRVLPRMSDRTDQCTHMSTPDCCREWYAQKTSYNMKQNCVITCLVYIKCQNFHINSSHFVHCHFCTLAFYNYPWNDTNCACTPQCPFAMHWDPCRSMPSWPGALVVPAGEPTT